jgi:hypothetical protein
MKCTSSQLNRRPKVWHSTLHVIGGCGLMGIGNAVGLREMPQCHNVTIAGFRVSRIQGTNSSSDLQYGGRGRDNLTN